MSRESVELHRDAVQAATRGGVVVIPWRVIADVTWVQAGDRWLRSEVLAADGTRFTLTHWLGDGRACAFLIQHGAAERGFPWEYLAAAEWAAPRRGELGILDGGVVERAKSGRSRCRTCGGLVARDELRFGLPARSSRPDHPTLRWHHLGCAEQEFPEAVAAAWRRASPS